jgi:hypothetical protein
MKRGSEGTRSRGPLAEASPRQPRALGPVRDSTPPGIADGAAAFSPERIPGLIPGRIPENSGPS